MAHFVIRKISFPQPENSRHAQFTCPTGRIQSCAADQSGWVLSCSQASHQHLNRMHTRSHRWRESRNFHSQEAQSKLVVSAHKNCDRFLGAWTLGWFVLLLESWEILSLTSDVLGTSPRWAFSKFPVVLHDTLFWIKAIKEKTRNYMFAIFKTATFITKNYIVIPWTFRCSEWNNRIFEFEEKIRMYKSYWSLKFSFTNSLCELQASPIEFASE